MSATERAERREMARRQQQMMQVLQLFQVEKISTTAIADRLDITEQMVCDLIEQSGWGR